MHTLSRIQLSLAEPSSARWAALQTYVGTIHQLIDLYSTDLGGTSRFHDLVRDFYESFLPPDYWQECAAIASTLDTPAEDVAVVNAYYDLVKLLIGCTAFAVDTDAGPLHARNLDWWTEHALLSTSTLIVEMVDAPAGLFQLVSWPGFIGALSGIAPGRFAISLNAALSDDPPMLARPSTFLLRMRASWRSARREGFAARQESPYSGEP